MAIAADETTQLRLVEQQLLRAFAGRVPDEDICREVSAGMSDFRDARIRTFIPVLLQKRVADRLRRRTSERSLRSAS
jgi:hypothetical protein